MLKSLSRALFMRTHKVELLKLAKPVRDFNSSSRKRASELSGDELRDAIHQAKYCMGILDSLETLDLTRPLRRK